MNSFVSEALKIIRAIENSLQNGIVLCVSISVRAIKMLSSDLEIENE